jgi:PAS domain S-box-containing protein
MQSMSYGLIWLVGLAGLGLGSRRLVREELERTLAEEALRMDITERKRMEQALQESKELLQQVIHTDPNLIFVKDRDGNFLLVNQAVADLFGTTPEQLIHQNNASVHADAQEIEHYSQIDRQVIDTMREVALDESFTQPNGEVLWFHTIKKPLRACEKTPTFSCTLD